MIELHGNLNLFFNFDRMFVIPLCMQSPPLPCTGLYSSCVVTQVMSVLDEPLEYNGQISRGAKKCLTAAVTQSVQL